MIIKPSQLRSIVKHANELGLKKRKIFSYDVKRKQFLISTELGVREIAADLDDDGITLDMGPR
jgi:hypothetical protein